jgi:hypothetical protein
MWACARGSRSRSTSPHGPVVRAPKSVPRGTGVKVPLQFGSKAAAQERPALVAEEHAAPSASGELGVSRP